MERNTTNARNQHDDELVRLRTPEDLLAHVPYLVGYHPSESLVALAITADGSCAAALRSDLLDPGDERERDGPGSESRPDPSARWLREQAAYVVAVLRKRRAARTVVIFYSDSPRRGGALLDPLSEELAAAGIDLSDAIWAAPGRWRSLLCPDPRCCPPEGKPYDLASHPVTARAVYRGEVALAGEDELRESVAPLLGPVRETMLEVTTEVTRKVRDTYRSAGSEAFRRDGKAYVTELLDRCVERDRPPTDHEVAWLSVFICDLLVRDAAWLRMRRETAQAHIAFWRSVARRAVPPFDVAPTTLLAFAAWLAGNGALARCALERALATDPSYSMAYVVRDALAGMVPPSVWPPDVGDERMEAA